MQWQILSFPVVLILRRHPKLYLDNFIPRPGTSPESGAAIHLSGNQVKSTYASPATAQRDEAFGTLWYFRLGRPGIGMPGEAYTSMSLPRRRGADLY